MSADHNQELTQTEALGLRDKVVVVTGASSGIGAAAARRFARVGAKVVASGRDEQRLAAVAEQIRDAGGEVTTVRTDFLLDGAPQELVEAAVAAYDHIDVIVTAAGAVQRVFFPDQTAETLNRMLKVNLAGPFLTAQAALPHLTEGSVLLFVSSSGAMRGNPGLAAYSASKSGLEGMARTLAIELAPKTRVNVFVPGFFDTAINEEKMVVPGFRERVLEGIPVGFIPEGEDAADTIVFLCSPQSRYIHGTTIVMDGGSVTKAPSVRVDDLVAKTN